MTLKTRRILISIIGLFSIFVAAFLSLTIGSSGTSFSKFIQFFNHSDIDKTYGNITFYLRLPRTIFGLLAGTILAVSGAVFQAILKNPLAEPYILGLSGGAALGGVGFLVASSIIPLTLSNYYLFGLPIFSFLGALLVLTLLFFISRRGRDHTATSYQILLTGVILNSFAGAGITFLESLVSPYETTTILFYLMGSLDISRFSTLELGVGSTVAFFCLLIIFNYLDDLNLISLGDNEAQLLGVNVTRVRTILLSTTSIAVGITVAYIGMVGFVGLIVPHFIRLLIGGNHKWLIPLTAIFGASFLVIADLFSRALFPILHTTLPIGATTALIGSPIFIILLKNETINHPH